MTKERFNEIFNYEEDPVWEGDNALEGLKIIQSYFDKNKTVIIGANKDIIYSVNVRDILKAGITEDDAVKLRSYNWMINEGTYLACFV
jgi:hypothetical protein